MHTRDKKKFLNLVEKEAFGSNKLIFDVLLTGNRVLTICESISKHWKI